MKNKDILAHTETKAINSKQDQCKITYTNICAATTVFGSFIEEKDTKYIS